MARAARWVAAAVLLAGIGGVRPTADAETLAVNLKVVGRSDLGTPGVDGDITVLGTTAVVAVDGVPGPGSTCPPSSAVVVDLKDVRHPRVVSTIAVPAGMTATDLDSASLATAAFTGDVVAMALAPCNGRAGATVVLHDITDPARPALLSQTAPCPDCGPGPQSVSLAWRSDNRLVAATVNARRPGLAVDDVTDPAHPVLLGRWDDQPGTAGCAPAQGLVTAQLADDGLRAIAVSADGRVHQVDLADPARPVAADPTPAPADLASPRSTAHAAVLPLGRRSLAIVTTDGVDELCASGPPSHGVRLLGLGGVAPPVEQSPIRFPTPSAPGRLVASGELAYITWHGDGIRVIDLGEVRPRTIAQFAPAGGDVVGVALLPDHVVVTDASLGLFVLERPGEDGGRAGFWSQFLRFLPYLGFATVASAALVVPRVAAAAARAGSAARSPVGSPVRRSRA